METVFKKSDKVFDVRYGWGIVTDINYPPTPKTPIKVEFDESVNYYTLEGYDLSSDLIPTLSFTEYTLQGFSQERPEVLPNRGDVVWVRNSKKEDWICTQYMWKVDGYYRVTDSNPWKESNGVHFIFLTTINPYSNE